MDDEKADNGRHGERVEITGGIVTAEHSAQFLQLYRLPDGEARQHDDDACYNDAEIKQLLHGVVDREIIVGELSGECGSGIRQDLAGVDRNEFAPEAPSRDTKQEIDETIHRQ